MLQQPRIQAVPRRTRIPSVRTRSSRQDSHDDRDSQNCDESSAERAHWSGHTPSALTRSSADAVQKNGGKTHKNSREKVVQTHHEGVEVGQYGDPADDGLARNP